MKEIKYAISEDGEKIPYIWRPDPPRGGMKHTYFSPDYSYVVQFFNNPQIIQYSNLYERLKAIIGKYNPTISEQEGGAKGNTVQTAQYFSKLFCWPQKIIKYPEFGIVCPAYSPNYFFDKNSSFILNLNGKDKKSDWFTSKNRRYLEKEELGDFRRLLQICILLSRGVRRMHQAGLAHSDLSNNNVLIDPKSGKCIIIDIDSLVVPNIFPPEVIGTRRYIAPEIMNTLMYSHEDVKKYIPNVYTDLHALAVLLYEYIFCRHPLLSSEEYFCESSEKKDFLTLGSKAVFIEHTLDNANKSKDLKVTIKCLGSILEELFMRAFVEGLYCPEKRPTALEWERGLLQTYDLLYPCENPACEKKWFVLHNNQPVKCPFCGSSQKNKEFVKIELKKKIKGQQGQWLEFRELNITENFSIYKWHIFSNIFADEKADTTLQAYIEKRENKWFFVNKSIEGLVSPRGIIIPKGQRFLLKNKDVFQASEKEQGMLMEFLIKTF